MPVLSRLLPCLILIAICLGACDTVATPTQQQQGAVGSTRAVTARDLQIVTGQMIYVPAYSEIFLGTGNQTIELAVTLSIHNTDLELPIIVQSVRYYDTDGQLVTDYVPEPIEVGPLATIGYVVQSNDRRGGWGANFIVEWGAEQPVHEPIVEAVMINTRSTQGISMISPGRILSQTTDPDTVLTDITPAAASTATSAPVTATAED
ncbi:DUF3124 domain-containing protein [Phototrophicus methaneseepsis]|uniref:DUF3124 domain-containing protein n=1 Tax=Phototrophicus methaneseepsis TaxID=2710758 RepID=A0A7S8EC40_9CHLR|nr:DUF3124 domain-containing protein [Phototrophicus methaneseepsis]QPC84204.1 DUF3124 domain-containing protein [Phototrophicus methaneseepsis]